MASWFGRKRGGDKGGKMVVDGTEIQELVENREAFATFVNHKFEELDKDHDGKLSVKELQPAVADIGAALGLPAQGDSVETDHIYSEVLSEFTHGNHKHVSKSKFQKVLSDVLLGMADGLKRDPIVILRIDGEDLKAYIDSQRFEIEVVQVFSKLESAKASLHECIIAGLEQLKVDQGMPPASDSSVRSNIVDPVLASLPIGSLKEPVTQEIALVEFKKVLQGIVQRLQEHPVIVAHSENTFDGSGIKKLLANRFELDKLLDSAWRELPRDRKEKASKEYLRVALDGMATSAGLPPYGAIDQFDIIVNDAVKMLNADDGKLVREEEFKKMMIEILGVIMFKLEGNPIFVSSNSVVHEPTASSSTLLVPSSTIHSK